MDPNSVPASGSGTNVDYARLEALVDKSSAVVDALAYAYDYAETLVTDFKGDKSDSAFLELKENRNKAESRLEAARNRLAAATSAYSNWMVAREQLRTAEASKNNGKSPAVPSDGLAVNKKTIKRKLPEPVDGWKDNAGKTHKKHNDAFNYNLVLNTVLWQLFDTFIAASAPVDEATHDPDADVKLARLIPRTVIERDFAKFTVQQLLEIGLNYVHEASHALYLTHAYSNTVAEAFLGDPIHGAERTVPVEERVDTAKYRKALRRKGQLSGSLPVAEDLQREGVAVRVEGEAAECSSLTLVAIFVAVDTSSS